MKYQILHIEDSKTDADLVKRLIQKSGLDFSYQLASDKKEVIDALDLFEPNIVICDHSLPSFNSKMAYWICKEKNPDLPFRLVTGSVSEEFAVDMLKSGIDDYLLKSNLQRLPVAIEQAFGKRQNEKKVEGYRSELNRSEIQLRTIFENSSNGLLLLNKDFTVIEFNSLMAEYSRLTMGGSYQKNDNILDVLPPERGNKLKNNFEKVFNGQQVSYESVYTVNEGITMTFLVNMNPVNDAKGKIEGVCVSITDITKQKKAEQVIRDSEEKHRNLVEQASDAILIFSFDGIIHEFNKACYAMLGYTKEEYAKLKLTDILVDDIIVSEDNYAAILAGQTKTVNRNLMHKNGSLLETEIAVKQLADGKAIAFARDITERKKAEQETKNNERQLNVIYNTVSDSIFMLSIEDENRFKFISVNATFLQKTGLSEEQVVGQYVHNIIPPRSLQLVLQKYNEAITERRAVSWEEVTAYPSGTKTGVVTISPVIDEKNNCTMLVGSVHDITERKQINDEMKSLANRLQLATESAGMGIWDWDITNDYLLFDEGMYRLYKIDNGHFGSVYKAWSSRLHLEDYGRVNEEIQMALEGKKQYDTEFRIIWEDQSVHYIKATGITESDDKGNAIRMIGVNWDITAQKEREQQLKLLESVITNTTDAVMITEAEPFDEPGHRIVYVNEAFTKMTGYSSGEVLGKTPRILQGPKTDKAALKRFSEAIRKWQACEVTVVNYKKSGEEYWANFSVSPVANENDWYTHWIAIERDVTEQKLAEIKLKELNEMLQNHAKELALSIAELEQFAFVASHDLQEPLRMITSFLTQLEKKYGDVIDDKGKKYIGFAVDGAKRMRQIILDLLEFSRVGTTEENNEELDLNELLTETKILLRKKIEEQKADIIIDPLPQINTYRSPLRQVFQNLVSNALKYSNKEIPVQVHISFKELKDHWQFEVIDNGIGINKEYFDKIFIIFQRLHNKDEYSGTGMGLAITKKIIERLGGKIWVESEEGKGSTFYFTLLKTP